MRSDFIFDRLNENEVKNFEIKIDEEKYFFRGIFMNPDASVVTVSKPTIKRLTIKDNIFKPFLDASVMVNDQTHIIKTRKNLIEFLDLETFLHVIMMKQYMKVVKNIENLTS